MFIIISTIWERFKIDDNFNYKLFVNTLSNLLDVKFDFINSPSVLFIISFCVFPMLVNIFIYKDIRIYIRMLLYVILIVPILFLMSNQNDSELKLTEWVDFYFIMLYMCVFFALVDTYLEIHVHWLRVFIKDYNFEYFF